MQIFFVVTLRNKVCQISNSHLPNFTKINCYHLYNQIWWDIATKMVAARSWKTEESAITLQYYCVGCDESTASSQLKPRRVPRVPLSVLQAMKARGVRAWERRLGPGFNSQQRTAFRLWQQMFTAALVVLYLICVLHVKGIDDSTAVASLTDEALLGTQQTLSDVFLPNPDSLPQSVIECTTVNLY